MNKIGAFFILVRWPNLLITALMMCLVHYCLVPSDSAGMFTLLVISMVLVQAGGYVINDIFDKDIDAINKPEKQIVGKDFTERQCHIFYITLTIIGLCCALADTRIFACMVLLACLLYSYSRRYKKKFIIGNLIVSLSVAFAVFVPWLYEMLHILKHELLLITMKPIMQVSLRFVLIYTAFAFIMTFIREIVKDMEDVEGDERSNCRTIPIVCGIKASQIIVLVLGLLTFVMIMYAKEDLHGLGFKTASYLMNASGIFMFMMVLGSNIFGLLDASFRTPKQFHIQSVAMKISMLIGVLSIFFIK